MQYIGMAILNRAKWLTDVLYWMFKVEIIQYDILILSSL